MVAISLVQDLKLGIEELSVAVPAPEVGLVLGSQKGAVMMVEPPGQPLVVGVLEVHDGVLGPPWKRWSGKVWWGWWAMPNSRKRAPGSILEA